MEKYSIAKNDLCIHKILTVVKSHIATRHKRLAVTGRHSDALIYVIDGSCTYDFDDGVRFTAKKGDVFYLPYQSVYEMQLLTEDYQFIFCDFEFAQTPIGSALFQGEDLTNAEGLFLKLLNAYRSPRINKQSECMAILYSIYSLLQNAAAQKPDRKNTRALIDHAKRYLEENFNDANLSIPHVAGQAQVSEVYFRRLFKEQVGTSPIKYLNSLRLKNALELMKYPFLSLEECATQSGFSSLQYFCRLFKKELGMSPGKLRERL